MIDIGQLRREFQDERLLEDELMENPYDQFEIWFNDACKAQIPTPNAMTLSTVDAAGGIHSRMVLLRKIERDGFTFFTRYDSEKARQIDHSPQAALHFQWRELNRQVSITGTLVKTSVAESRKFFASCNRRLRLASRIVNSEELITIDALEQKLEELEIKYDSTQIPMPDWWGGYRIEAAGFEFWQGRSNYIHDRIAYRIEKDDLWKRERKAP